MEEEYKESELSKIVKKLMDEEGYEFGEAVKEAMKKGYAYGGGVGHLMEPTQTYHQYHDFTAPMTVGAMVDNMYNRGGRVALQGGGMDASKPDFGKSKSTNREKGIMSRNKGPQGTTGNINNSGGGGGRNNNPPQLTLVDKNPNVVKDTVTNAAINFGAKELGLGNLVHPAFLLKGAYDYFKNPKIKDEDVTLETSEVTNNLPDNTLVAELNDMQKKMLEGPQKQLKDIMGISNEEILQNISPFNTEETPATIEDVNKFYAADGGRVGMFMGGDPLTGQALAIYNSMNDYGFSDQEIADALQTQGYYTPPDSGTPDPTPDPTPTPGQGGGQGGGGGEEIMELQKTYRTLPGNPKNYRLSQLEGSSDYFPPTTKIGKTKNFLQEKFFQPKVKGTLGDRLLAQSQGITSTIPSLTGILGNLRSPFNPKSPTYNPNLPGQLNFLEGSPMVTRKSGQFINPKLGAVEGNFMDVTGALIGRDPNSGHLKYGPGSVLSGKNVISGFGTNDYETMLMDYITKMGANERISAAGKAARLKDAKAELAALTGQKVDDITTDAITTQMKIAKTNKISAGEAAGIMKAIDRDNRATESRGRADLGKSYDAGTYCFDPNTLVQMADGSEKKIKEIQLGDATKGGEVTGVFQFKASDEIHDYKGVTVAGSHYVKEDGKFIMVQDSPLSVKIDKIPVVYSLDTTGRRIFINDIEFADYNGDGVAKNFLTNAGVDLTGFNTEVLRQVEHRLI
tara:strand:- start:457 stop:2667 length:2211 start_codon:yes stop_codon:yes gene_type:complete